MATRPFESRIQDLVYNIEVGIGLQVVKIFLYVLLMCTLAVLYMATEYSGFSDKQAMDYGQLARNVAESGKLNTNYVRPASMWFLMKNGKFTYKDAEGKSISRIDVHPDIVNAPAYPLVLGGVFRLAKTNFAEPPKDDKYAPEQWVIVPVNLLFCFLSALFLYLLGRQLFDPRVALTGTTIFFLSNTVWADALSGLESSMAMFLTTFALWSGVKVVTSMDRPDKRWVRAFIFLTVGTLACVGLFLTRYIAVTFVPGFLFLIWAGIGRKGWIFALTALFLFLAGSSPWLIRNLKVSDTLFGLAPYSALHDKNMTFERQIAPDVDPPAIASQLSSRFNENFGDAMVFNQGGVSNALLFSFFIVTYFYRFQRRPTHLLRWGVFISWILLIICCSIWGDETWRVQHTYLPVVILFGTAFFYILLDRMQITVKIVSLSIVTLFVALQALPMIFTILPPRPGNNYPPYNLGLISFISKPFKKTELICTDMPWATAWYGNLNSLHLPTTLDEFYEVNDYHKRISLLYFTPITRDKRFNSDLTQGSYRSWFPITQFRMAQDFPLRNPAQLMNGDQVLLSDYNRWSQ